MLSATGLHLAFGPQTILDGVSVTLDPGVRAGLVGANGSGKTTFLKILAEDTVPDAGEVTRGRNATLAYLPQRLDVPAGETISGLADRGFRAEHTLVSERAQLADRLSRTPDDTAALARLAEIDDTLERRGYHERATEIARVLHGLGFAQDDLHRPLGEFSGGWQMRASLARTLLTRADFLLLDEPTNYLDSEARLWLADFIRGYDGGVVLVSHDRAFLDDSVSIILELFGGRLRRYKGSYSEYEARRTQELEQLVKAWAQQQEEIRRQEEFVRRFRAKASKARQVQSRVKTLEKTDRIEIPQHLRPISISLPPPPHCGDQVLELDGVTRRYDSHLVLEDLQFTLRRGQRLAVVGLNGAGKSTLLRILAGNDTPTAGSVRTGTGVQIAYYAQDSADTLPTGTSVYDYLASRASDEALPRVRSMLGSFLFDEDAIDKPLDVLSGGERSRLVIAGLLVQPANLLILDEPTNHLDMTSQEVLARALSSYQGSAVVVSHDRHFLRAVSTDVLALWPHSIDRDQRPPQAWRYYPGSYREFEGSHLGEVFATAERGETPGSATAASSAAGSTGENRPAGDDYARQKALRGEVRRLQRREHEVLEEMERLEHEHGEIQHAMSLEENYTDPERIRDLQDRLQRNEADQHRAGAEWESLVTRLQELGVES